MGKETLLNIIFTVVRLIPSSLIEGFLESIIEKIEDIVVHSENKIDDILFTSIMNVFGSYKLDTKKLEKEDEEC